MDSSHAIIRSTSLITKVLSTAFLLFVLASSPFVGHAAGVTVTGGIVQYVSGPAVTVQGKIYDIRGARIMAPSGKELPLSAIARGKKVDLFVEMGKITSVIIYPTGLVE